MKVLIILLIVFVIYQIIRYLIILYNRSILPIYYSHGELVGRYAYFIYDITYKYGIISIMDAKETNITVYYSTFQNKCKLPPYLTNDIVKIIKFKNGKYYIDNNIYIKKIGKGITQPLGEPYYINKQY